MAENPPNEDAKQQQGDPAPEAQAQPNDAEEPSVEAALDGAQDSLNQIKAEVEKADAAAADGAGRIELLNDVELHVMIELGRTEMLVEDVLKLGEGSVVELDKLAGDPVDVYVNSRLVARGEVLVLNDNFCIRISEILADLGEQTEAAAEQVETATA